MKKITILLAGLALTGCANLKYPGWEQVKVTDSVYKQPCRFVIEEYCLEEGSAACLDWYKKRVIKNDANTLITPKNGTGQYFYCSAGLPPFIAKPKSIYLVKPSEFKPAATKIDYAQATAECTYESHKATVDTSGPQPVRAYTPTLSYSYNSAQLSAISQDSTNQLHHEIMLSQEESKLFSECLTAKGFVISHTNDAQSMDAHLKNCPELESHNQPCFIPNSPQ